jgi:hypothetical protein
MLPKQKDFTIANKNKKYLYHYGVEIRYYYKYKI